MFTRHALEQAKARFNLTDDDEAQTFVRRHLELAGTARKRPEGALRWTADRSLLWEDGGVHIVTTVEDDTLTVVTVYPVSPEQQVKKARSGRIGPKWMRKADHERRRLARRERDDGS